MDTISLFRTIRKVLKNMPLEESEQHIFESWQSGALNEDLIFEQTTPEPEQKSRRALEHAISHVQFFEQLHRLFEKLFVPVIDSTNKRVQLSFVDFPEEDNPANLETSAGVVTAHYELRELDDLIPSHDPFDQFKRRNDYPEGVQERPYHSDGGEQEKVRRNASHLNPRYLINTNPDAMTGPPCISCGGIVLGGNSRLMSIQIAYKDYPEKAKKYKETLSKMAFSFGFAKKQVENMQKPVLVRVVNKTLTKEEMAQMSRRFNEVSTQALQLDAEGVSKSKLVSRRTMGHLQSDLQEFDTLREYLSNRKSLSLISSLVDDGVIEQAQLSRITDDKGLLNGEGKELVEAVLRGLIVQDYDLIHRTPPSVMNKIDRAIPALAQLKARGGEWDLSKIVTKALQQIQKACGGGTDMQDVSMYFATVPMISDPDREDKGIQAFALTLANVTPKELTARLNAFAAESAKTADGTNMLIADTGPSAEKSFAGAFLHTVASIGNTTILNFNPETSETHAALEWAAQASKSHTIDAAKKKLGKRIDSLDTPKEKREEAKKKHTILQNYDGAVSIYTPKLGSYFAYRATKGDTLLRKG